MPFGARALSAARARRRGHPVGEHGARPCRARVDPLEPTFGAPLGASPFCVSATPPFRTRCSTAPDNPTHPPSTPPQSEVEATLQRINGHKVRPRAISTRRHRAASLVPARAPVRDPVSTTAPSPQKRNPTIFSSRARLLARLSLTPSVPSLPRRVQGVLGTIIVNDEGEPLRATTICDKDGVPLEDQSGVVSRYAELVPQLASMARSMVRDLDPQNSLQFLRIRSKNHEIMVHSDPEFTLIVIQNPAATE